MVSSKTERWGKISFYVRKKNSAFLVEEEEIRKEEEWTLDQGQTQQGDWTLST
jgi:hypothetical protein